MKLKRITESHYNTRNSCDWPGLYNPHVIAVKAFAKRGMFCKPASLQYIL